MLQTWQHTKQHKSALHFNKWLDLAGWHKDAQEMRSRRDAALLHQIQHLHIDAQTLRTMASQQIYTTCKSNGNTRPPHF